MLTFISAGRDGGIPEKQMADTKQDMKDIRLMLEKIESIIDSRLIGIVEPEEDEISAIREYEKRKASGTIGVIE